MKTFMALMLTASATAFAGDYPEPPKDSCDKSCEAPRAVCPDANEMAITCNGAGVDVVVCVARDSHEHAHMIVNGGAPMRARKETNYATYMGFKSIQDNMIYELGLTSRNPGPQAQGYFSLTSEAHPELYEAVDVSCQLPF